MRPSRTSKRLLAAGCVAATILVAGTPSPRATAADETPRAYLIEGARTREARTAIARTGAGIEDVRDGAVLVRATAQERDAIAAMGFAVRERSTVQDFPPADAAYHTYDEMVSDVDELARAQPGVVHVFSLGTSYEGRGLVGVRVSDDPDDNLAEPGLLIVGLHHAREHLAVEVVLSILHMFAESRDADVVDLVRTRQIYIVPALNPDGGEYDVQGGRYRYWRKNRQPNAGSQYVGTDLNRNYSYRFGCCGGSSGNTRSETYRGPSPFSAPETAAMRDLVQAHPNITTALSYHSYGNLILYPYGYTYTDIPSDMTRLDHDTFVTIAGRMAAATGYTAQQASDLYITDGDLGDWMYGARSIYPFTFELGGGTFYPGAGIIPTESSRNRKAALIAAQVAACPVAEAGGSCSGGSPPPSPSPTPAPSPSPTPSPPPTSSPSPSPPPPGRGIVNGGFENGLSGWSATGARVVDAPVRTGGGAALICGRNAATDRLEQTFVVPASGRLELWVRVEGSDRTSNDTLQLEVAVSSSTRVFGRLLGANAGAGWIRSSSDLTAYAGQRVTLRMSCSTDGAAPTFFYVDDVSV